MVVVEKGPNRNTVQNYHVSAGPGIQEEYITKI